MKNRSNFVKIKKKQNYAKKRGSDNVKRKGKSVKKSAKIGNEVDIEIGQEIVLAIVQEVPRAGHHPAVLLHVELHHDDLHPVDLNTGDSHLIAKEVDL
jgi:hypothetical protein